MPVKNSFLRKITIHIFSFFSSNFSLVKYFEISRGTLVAEFLHQWGLSSWQIFTGLIRYLFYNENGSKPLFPLDTTVHLELIMVRHSGSKKRFFPLNCFLKSTRRLCSMQRCVTLSVTHTAAKSWVSAEIKYSKHPMMCVTAWTEKALIQVVPFSLW